jgi:hypothetical protein
MSAIARNEDALDLTQSSYGLGSGKVPVTKNSVRRNVMTLLATVSFVLTAPLAPSAQAGRAHQNIYERRVRLHAEDARRFRRVSAKRNSQ